LLAIFDEKLFFGKNLKKNVAFEKNIGVVDAIFQIMISAFNRHMIGQTQPNQDGRWLCVFIRKRSEIIPIITC
jgi:hypothetical protein